MSENIWTPLSIFYLLTAFKRLSNVFSVAFRRARIRECIDFSGTNHDFCPKILTLQALIAWIEVVSLYRVDFSKVRSTFHQRTLKYIKAYLNIRPSNLDLCNDRMKIIMREYCQSFHFFNVLLAKWELLLFKQYHKHTSIKEILRLITYSLNPSIKITCDIRSTIEKFSSSE